MITTAVNPIMLSHIGEVLWIPLPKTRTLYVNNLAVAMAADKILDNRLELHLYGMIMVAHWTTLCLSASKWICFGQTQLAYTYVRLDERKSGLPA